MYKRQRLFEYEGKFYFAIDDYDGGGDCVQVSEAFAKAFAAEFPVAEENLYYYSKDEISGYMIRLKFGGAK